MRIRFDFERWREDEETNAQRLDIGGDAAPKERVYGEKASETAECPRFECSRGIEVTHALAEEPLEEIQ
jgi:hypothetical protein